jgi:membrane protease YdiL (CAAX protease family)
LRTAPASRLRSVCGVLLAGGMVWLILEISGSARWQWLIHWNPWLILLAILPARGFSPVHVRPTAASGNCCRTTCSSPNWRWALISFLAILAYLLISAAIARVIGLSIVAPPQPGGWPTLAVPGAVSFARNLLFTAVFEEPGWRGNLLRHLRDQCWPLTASLLVWFPRMLWHRTAGSQWRSGPPLTGWLQIRMAFLMPMTILLTWIYNRSRRRLVCTALFHAALDTFPFVLPWLPPMLGLVFVWRSVPSMIVCGAATLSMTR